MGETVWDAAASLIVVLDFIVAAGLLWRGGGRPLPRRLAFLRRSRFTRWLFAVSARSGYSRSRWR